MVEGNGKACTIHATLFGWNSLRKNQVSLNQHEHAVEQLAVFAKFPEGLAIHVALPFATKGHEHFFCGIAKLGNFLQRVFFCLTP
jgi:hypothetical protein